ncbi:hypothetical protein CDIK_0589 [Cucumispora dikerogammari]|nr:hypothetical protein CDIK_0589 [Cucumispora dikerogammari]
MHQDALIEFENLELADDIFYLKDSQGKKNKTVISEAHRILKERGITLLSMKDLIKERQGYQIQSLFSLKDILFIFKNEMKISFITNYLESMFKVMLIIVCVFIFASNCNKSPDIRFKDLQSLLISKGLYFSRDPLKGNKDLESVFLNVAENLILKNTVDYHNDPIAKEFENFLLYKNEKELLTDILLQVLSVSQPLLDYSLPFILCDRVYKNSGYICSPLSYFIGQLCKTLAEQTLYTLVMLFLLTIPAFGVFTFQDSLIILVYCNLSIATYFLISSFIRHKRLFYLLIVVNIYINLLSYQSIENQFELIHVNYRLNFFTKIFSCLFIFLPATNFQAYFYHKRIEERVSSILDHQKFNLLRVQVWGMKCTRFKSIELLLLLGITNFVILVLLSGLIFCYQIRRTQ